MLEVVPQNFEHIPAEQFVRTAYRRALELRKKLSRQSFGGDADRWVRTGNLGTK
jgi:hypothetical protein